MSKNITIILMGYFQYLETVTFGEQSIGILKEKEHIRKAKCTTLV
jgi:hypothetical protein